MVLSSCSTSPTLFSPSITIQHPQDRLWKILSQLPHTPPGSPVGSGVCGGEAEPSRPASLGLGEFSSPHQFSNQRCLVSINLCLFYFNEEKYPTATSLTCPLTGDIILCCTEESERMRLFWERATSGRAMSSLCWWLRFITCDILLFTHPAVNILLRVLLSRKELRKQGCILLFVLFLSLGYHCSIATPHGWCPPTSTSEEHIFSKAKKLDCFRQCLRLVAFLITRSFPSKQTNHSSLQQATPTRGQNISSSSDTKSHTDKTPSCGFQGTRSQALCVPTGHSPSLSLSDTVFHNSLLLLLLIVEISSRKNTYFGISW